MFARQDGQWRLKNGLWLDSDERSETRVKLNRCRTEELYFIVRECAEKFIVWL